MEKVIHVAIATISEAKIEGVKKAFEKLFPNTKIEIVAKKTKSDVPEQPFGKDTIKGALNRVGHLMELLNEDEIIVDYYVSCEAGIDDLSIPGEFFSEQVVYVYSKNSRRGFWGKSSSWSIPKEDIQEIVDTDLNQYLIKRGCTGLQDIGNGKYITRTDAVEEGIKAALVSEMNYLKSKALENNKSKKLDDVGENR